MHRLPDRVDAGRLVLRRWQHDEAATLQAVILASIEHLRPWMSWIATEPLTLAERVTLIEEWTRAWEAGGDSLLGVFLDGEAIGNCGLHRRGPANQLEIGYWIAPTHIRRGYATELTAALTAVSFAIDGIDRVTVVTDEANTASAAIPATLGFIRDRIDAREPVAPAETGRMITWAMSKDNVEGSDPTVYQSVPNVSR